MLTKRLQAIADLVPTNKSVIDIGTDHAYIPIYLYQKNITRDITASDISSKVLEYSLENLKKYNLDTKIPLILSNGLSDIQRKYDVAIIAGMGTHTIKSILNSPNIPNTLIIQSNNDHFKLRKFMMELGYKIDSEIVIHDKKHHYIIIRYIKGFEKLTEAELTFGKSNNLEYLNHLRETYQYLYTKSKDKIFLDYINMLDDFIEKILDC